MPKQQNDDNIFDELDESASSEFNDETTQQKDYQPATKKKTSFKDKIIDLWKNPKKRKIVIGSALAIVLLIAVVPHSRYFVLNLAGIRSSASVRVLDQSTGQPLKNVSVQLAGAENKTDNDGVAKLERIKLGSTNLKIEKRAFANKEQKLTIGWGSNPLGDFKVEPTGLQYSFKVTDFLSGKPIEKAEAVSGEYSGFSDVEGLAVITIEDPGEEAININLQAEGYRTEEIVQEKENKDVQNISMVPARKHVFVSKRTGKYDVYKIDADSQNEELILSGTGNEKQDMTLVQHPDRDFAVLVSTRDSVRNQDGFLLSTLTLIDLSGEEVKTESLATSERIQVIDWHNEHLVYVRMVEGASASKPDRHRLVTYNTDTGVGTQIASSNYFNDVLMVEGKVYYAPSSAYQDGAVGMYKVDANGENNEQIFNQEVWNIFRTDYDQMIFSVNNDWYEYKINDNQILAASGPPAIQLSRLYVNGPENVNKSIWIDQRDGKGTIIEYDKESSDEKTIYAQSGLTYPASWMNQNTIVFRVSTDLETADYIVSIDGGDPKKIIDVTNTGGVDRWYYY